MHILLWILGAIAFLVASYFAFEGLVKLIGLVDRLWTWISRVRKAMKLVRDNQDSFPD